MKRISRFIWELGCGKGQFILSLAQAFPQRNFIAVEGNASVVARRALQKAARLFCQFPDENMRTKEGNEKPFEKIIRRGVFAVRTQKECELTINDETSGLTVSEESESGTSAEKNGKHIRSRAESHFCEHVRQRSEQTVLQKMSCPEFILISAIRGRKSAMQVHAD